MICGKCGSVIKDGSKFCPICGGSIPAPSQATIQKRAYNQVNYQNKSNQRYDYSGQNSNNNSSSGTKTAIIVVLIIALVGVVAYFLINQNSSAEDGDDTVDVNPFEYLTVNFSGADGSGTVDFFSTSTEFTSNYFSAGSSTTNLSNGDIVTIVFDVTAFANVHPEYNVPTESKDYQVVGLTSKNVYSSGGSVTENTTAAEVVYDYSLPSDLQVPGSANGYILPESATRKYTEAELSSFTNKQLRYARNEITARHGRMFADELLQEYFNERSWYYPQYEPEYFDANIHEKELSSIEKYNMNLITKIEDSRKKN